MQKNAIIGVIAVAVIVAIAVPLASPLFIKGDSANEPLPDGAIIGELNEPVMDDTMMDDDKMMDDKMEDTMMDDDKMMDDTMMDDDKMMDDKMEDTMMDDDKMTGEMEDTQMTDEEMKTDMMSQDGQTGEEMSEAEKTIEIIRNDLEENGDTMSDDKQQMLKDMIEEIKNKGVSASGTMIEEETPVDAMPAEKQEEMQIKKYAGEFIGADMYSHRVEGNVITVPTMDGKTFLRLTEDFDSGNGPKLVVYLVPNDDRRDGEKYRGPMVKNDYIDLGILRGTSGAQNYEIPPGTDLEKYSTALIWCEPFSALFGYAELK